MTQAGQFLNITDAFNVTVKSPVPLHYGMKDDIQNWNTFLCGCTCDVCDCGRGRREREKGVESLLKFRQINKYILTNYIQYTVGDPVT
jgi:hypothetical protein